LVVEEEVPAVDLLLAIVSTVLPMLVASLAWSASASASNLALKYGEPNTASWSTLKAVATTKEICIAAGMKMATANIRPGSM
jgi:hypothetical protein